MASYSDYRYAINGIVGTDKTVLKNMETLAGAAASWITYDTHDGLWSVVINEAGTSVASFDDSNIIGAISIAGSGLESLYNSVRVEFPHIDLNDEKDFIHDSLSSTDLFPNESDNVLNIQYDILNDPVQAEYLGLIELKQNRLDQLIQFKTDFSQIGLKAGDLIDITSTTYGFTNKMFRIEKLVERDSDDGSIEIDITAREYSASVYSTDDLSRYTRENSTGIQTIGNIGVPGTPTVSKVEKDARPRVTISSTTPTGTVDAMEFWYTTDTYVYDENRVYQLLDRVKPSFGNTFPFGNTVTITSDSLSSGNLYVKTRGVNGQTIGPFSSPAGFVYTPVQTTNNIDENTTASTSTGSLITALGALTLLNNLDQLFSGNTASGGVFKKVFDLFSSNTGYNILNDAGNLKTVSNTMTNSNVARVMTSAVASTKTTANLAQTGTSLAYMGSGEDITFTAPVTGQYKFDLIADQNFSQAKGRRGTMTVTIDGSSSTLAEGSDYIGVGFFVYPAAHKNDDTYLIAKATTGGLGAQYWMDFAISAVGNLTKGESYTIAFWYLNNTYTTGDAQFDLGMNVYTISQ
jgi:hypothetical protein